MTETHDSRIRAMYEAGALAWLLKDYQLPEYDDFCEWNQQRQTRAHLQWVKSIDALYDNMWLDECGRRYGKTVKWLIIQYMDALQRPGFRGLIATPLRGSIGGIIVPLTKLLFADAPKELFPRYKGSNGADHECLYIEALDSTIKLVGLDKHPDATRGQFLDAAHITEAAFVKGLYELITAVVMPQFRYRPWAWIALESSTAKAPDCDFNLIFREDAKLRGTYRIRTIRDNPELTEDEIETEERRSGGRDSHVCQRELYCKEVRDPDDMVVPEFDESVHVVDNWPTPDYALCSEGFDPGLTDPCGLVGGYLDWMSQCFVIQFGWHKSNASTGEVVATAQAFEREFWGSGHRAPGERKRELSIADAIMTGDGKVWDPPSEALTYWEQGDWSLKANPYSRISDIANRFILDLNVDYGMNIRPAEKGPGSAEADLQHLRTLFAARPARIRIMRNGKTDGIIAQLRSGMWNTDENGHRTDWQRSKTLGHLDELAALKYLVRDIRWNRNPSKPPLVDVNVTDTHVPKAIRDQAQGQQPVTTPWGGRGRRTYAGRGTRPFR